MKISNKEKIKKQDTEKKKTNSVNEKRIHSLNKENFKEGPVFYWMSRDQRVDDNWALIYAQQLAISEKKDLAVVFFLSPFFADASFRQYDFMIKGLKEVESKLKELNIPFFLFLGSPIEKANFFLNKFSPGIIVSDFDPLKIKREWREEMAKKAKCSFFEVDAHNIVPCREASSKKEYAAYTIRPKITKMLPEFLTDFPKLKKQRKNNFQNEKIDWEKAYKSLSVDFSVTPVKWIKPGETEAKKILSNFLNKKIKNYSKERNDPNKEAQSNLSPYLHFGQISAQRVAFLVKRKKKENCKDFLEELIIRKELSDNYCFYNDHYDSFDGFPRWAKDSLTKHKKDKREYLYSGKEFENGETHDELWNAAQMEMVKKGKMHGYMRMYWAKKILEWSKSPKEAIKTAIYLNDKYELDGRDSRGYTGIAWSIGGVHDRAWGERLIFGKVRYMSYNGSKGKFNVEKYIKENKH